MAVNYTGNPIATVTPFDAAQAIVVEDFESFPVLHAKRPRLTSIKEDGPDYCRVNPALGFARNLPFWPQGRMKTIEGHPSGVDSAFDFLHSLPGGGERSAQVLECSYFLQLLPRERVVSVAR